MVSVIVPVYNAEQFLARCVESILGQTHRDLELILVDDGSTDESPSICDSFAVRDPRVRVLHKTNGGVSAARNDGLGMARGEWIAFCDNDDHMAPGTLQRLLEICLAHDCDIAHCRRERSLAESLPQPPPEEVKVFTNREILEDFYTYATPYIWDKLYRRCVWDEVRFPVGSYAGEDVSIVHHLLWAARRVGVTREKLYCHYLNPDSVMLSGFDVRWATGALNDRAAFARREGLDKLYADTMTRRVWEQEYLLVMNRKYNRNRSQRRSFAREHRGLKRRYWHEAMRTEGIPTRARLLMTLCLVSPPLYNLYNYLKWRVIRGVQIKFGEVK